MAQEILGNQDQTYLTSSVLTTPAAGTIETWTVNDTSQLPSISGIQQFRLTVGPSSDLDPEIVICNGIASGTQIDVIRGAEGSTIKTHAVGDPVYNTITRDYMIAVVPPTGAIEMFGGFNAPTGWVLCDGNAYSRTLYADLFSTICIVTTGNTHSNLTLDGLPTSAVQNMQVGMPVSGTNILVGTTILAILSTTSVQLSNSATGTTTGGSVVVAPYGVGDGTTTFNVPDMRGRSPVGAWPQLGGNGLLGAANPYWHQITNLAPVGAWGLDDTSGTTAVDSSTSLNNGTYNGGFTLNQAGPLTEMPLRLATILNGSTGYISAPYKAGYDTQHPSVEVWVKPTSMTATYGFFEKSTNGNVNTQYLLFADNTGLFFRVVDNAAVQHTLGYAGWPNLPAGVYYHIVGLYDGSNLCLYINGVLVAKAALTVTLATGSGAGIKIGQLFPSATTYSLNGAIANVALYNFALSPAQVEANYRAGVPFVLGASGGEESHLLATTELSPHSHGVTDPTHGHTTVQGITTLGGTNSGWIAIRDDASTLKILGGTGGIGITLDQPSDFTVGAASTGINTTQSTGGNLGHNNLSPYLPVNYIIKI